MMTTDNVDVMEKLDISRDKRRRVYKLEFGAICCKHIALSEFYHFYKIASNKVIVDCGNMDWERMMSDNSDVGNWNDEMVQGLMKMADFNSLKDVFDAMSNRQDIIYNDDSVTEFLHVSQVSPCAFLLFVL